MIIYLHGLNSAGSSGKAAVFCDRLAPAPVLSPTYPAHRPQEAVECLSAFLRRQPGEYALIGSSMGGFYGQYLARHFPVRHLYLINPALRPWDLLLDLVGEQHNEATGERYVLSAADIEQTRRFGLDQVCDGVPTTLFVDKGDELIDYRIAEAMYGRCARMALYDGGSHLFAHMEQAVALIRGDLGL